MRRLRSHPLIILLCALCLLGAQQAANAHFIGHLGTATATIAFHASGGEEAPGLESVCTMCAAFAALLSAPPAQAPTLCVVRVPSIQPRAAAAIFTPAAPAPPYASRAPPTVL